MARKNHKAESFTKIGDFRGSPRLWLEGRKLERADILPGQRFDVTWDAENRKVVLVFGEEGERKVSRRRRGDRELPIIDINARELEDVFGAGLERARVLIEKGRVVVEPHPLDLRTKERFDRMVSAIQAGRPLETGSLAHGGGILDHALHTGLKDEGLEARLAFAVEIEADKLDVAATNNPIWDEDTLQIEAPMQEVRFKELPAIDVLAAGLPCVGASRSGKAKNKISNAEAHPTAGALFYAFLRTVEETNPGLVILENVVDYGREVSAEVIRAKLAEWGYSVYEFTMKGNDYGALENRERLCIVGLTKQFPLDISRLQPIESMPTRIADILDDVPLDDPAWKDIGYLERKAVRDKEAGKGFALNLVDIQDTKLGTMGAGYAKWRQTEPKIPHPEKPGFARQLTPAEHARAKGIPPYLVENVSNTLAHEILGNSVIWNAFRAVGAMIGAQVATEAGRQPLIEVKATVNGRERDCLNATVDALHNETKGRRTSMKAVAKKVDHLQAQFNLDLRLHPHRSMTPKEKIAAGQVPSR